LEESVACTPEHGNQTKRRLQSHQENKNLKRTERMHENSNKNETYIAKEMEVTQGRIL